MEFRYHPDPDRVIRYDVVYYDFNWEEIEELRKRMVCAHDLIIMTDEFNTWQQNKLAGRPVTLPTLRFPWFLGVEVCIVEI